MKKFCVLVTDGISSKGVQTLQDAGNIEVIEKGPLKENELIQLIPSVDALLVRSQTKVTATALAAAAKLKAIGRAGVGVDNVDAEAATARGIVVMNTPSGNTISTAEHAFSLLLSMARHIPQAHATMVAGQWDRKSFQGVELCNKTLGIVGMGRIGGEVARRAIAFGMRVLAYDPYLAASRAKSLQVELVEDLNALLKEADFITVHMPLTPETDGLLNAENLKLCKRGVRLVNCARGGLIREADLLGLLKSGQVAAAALDVFEQEPLPKESEFRALSNVVLTPHLGASTAEAQESVGIEIAEAVRDFLFTGAIRNAVNMPSLDARALVALKPYLQLGEKLGRLLSQIAPKRIESLVVRYQGRVNELDTASISRTILKGFLLRSEGDHVNEVNAPRLAQNLGLRFSETKQSDPADFSDLITLEAVHEAGSNQIAGTFFGPHPRIVGLEGYSLEASPEGVLLIAQNTDRPGMVSWISGLLAKHKINIANMSLARATPGGKALCLLNLDTSPSEEVLNEISTEAGIHSVKLVVL